jgi:signal transduction histidine kinase/CheY-like chemotaxis protein
MIARRSPIPLNSESRSDPAAPPAGALLETQLAIHELGGIVASGSLQPEEKLEALLRLGCRHFSLSTCVVSTVEGEISTILACHDAWGVHRAGDVAPLRERFCSAVVSGSGPVAFERATGTRWEEHPAHHEAGVEAYLGAALRVNGRLAGTLAFHDPSARALPFSESEVDFLQLLAQMVASELERRDVDRIKREFVSVVSHELRTPLTSVRGALGLLASGRMGQLDERGQRMLEIAGQNTDRLVRMINDILDLERIQSGEMEMRPAPESAASLLDSAVEEMRALAERAGVSIEVEVGEERVFAHRERIVQVLTGLIGNAVKHSSAGSVVRLTATPAGSEIRFVVEDRGPGIAPERLERIFERFEQVDSSDSRSVGGSGLGLTLARGIVRKHGGTISVESRVGEGSRFIFTLPRPPRAAAARPAPEPPLVLICDDDQAVCRFLQLMLEARGYRTGVAHSGEEIISLAARQRPAVILLDFQLSGINGRDTLSLLRQWTETRDIPVIMMSGQGQEESGIGESEIVAWIEKPIEQSLLFDALVRAFEGTPLHADVLLVEADDALAQVLTESLFLRGLSSYHVRTGAEAVRLARTLPFDLLVLEVGLPDRDGFAVVESIRGQSRLRNLPLLVYSAIQLDEPEMERLRMGPTEFLVKSRQPVRHLGDRAIALLGRATAGVDA